MLLFVLVLIANTVSAQWSQLTQPEGAQVTDITYYKGEIFIVAANTIYRSDDEGLTWTESRNGIPELADVSAITSTSNALYAGANDSGSGDKVFVSNDDGATWSATGGLGGLILAFDLEAIGDTVFMASNFGLGYRSTDGGATFEEITSVGFGGTMEVRGKKLYIMNSGSIRESVDRGETISEKIGTATDITFNFAPVRTAITVGSKFIVGGNGAYTLGEDSVWVPSSNGFPSFLGTPTSIITKLVEKDGNLWAFTQDGIFMSADTAGTWTLIENPINAGFTQEVTEADGKFFVATQTGMYVSDLADGLSSSFSKRVSGLNHVSVSALYSVDGNLFVVAPNEGILKSDDGGASFTQFADTLRGDMISGVTKTDTHFLVSTGRGIFRSTDGTDWELIESAPAISAVHANGSTVFGGVGSQIYRSTDGGENWEAVTTAFEIGAISPNSYAFHENAIIGTFSTLNVIADLVRSTDGGDTWEKITGIGGFASKVLFEGDVAYASITSLFTGGGVAVSDDFGATWTIPENELSDDVGGALGLAEIDGDLYTFNVNGFFKSTDGADSWEEFGTENLPVNLIGIGGPFTAHGGDLYFAPFINSVFKANVSGNPTPNETEEGVLTFGLSQNYPNPFNPSTNISFTLAQSGLTSLKVYNLLGQEVASLWNDNLTAGEHSFSFDASGLSSGTYIYRLVSGNFSQTKKMMLIK